MNKHGGQTYTVLAYAAADLPRNVYVLNARGFDPHNGVMNTAMTNAIAHGICQTSTPNMGERTMAKFYNENETALLEHDMIVEREFTINKDRSNERVIKKRITLRLNATLRDLFLEACKPATIRWQNVNRKKLEEHPETIDAFLAQDDVVYVVAQRSRTVGAVTECFVSAYRKAHPEVAMVPDDVLIGIVNSTGGKVRLVADPVEDPAS